MSLSAPAESFLAENHLCTLTTVRPDGTPHMAPVRFTWDGDAQLVRVMTTVTRRKTRNVLANPDGRVAVCQVAGFNWITLEGVPEVSGDPTRVHEGARRYAKRYWSSPPQLPGLVVIEITIDRVMGLY